MRDDPLISIGRVADRTGTTVSAIRFYADENLLPSVRSASGHRLFARSVLRRVSFILISQSLGYTLQEIKAVLGSLPSNRTPTKADWQRLSQHFSDDLDKKIETLQKLKSSLNSCIGCGCLSLTSCDLYNPDDSVAERGSGARFLLGDRPSKHLLASD